MRPSSPSSEACLNRSRAWRPSFASRHGVDTTPIVYTETGVVGLGFDRLPPEPLVVSQVLPGTWAQIQGFQVGDEVAEVNGIPASELGEQRLRQALSTRPLSFKLKADASTNIQTVQPHAATVESASVQGDLDIDGNRGSQFRKSRHLFWASVEQKDCHSSSVPRRLFWEAVAAGARPAGTGRRLFWQAVEAKASFMSQSTVNELFWQAIDAPLSQGELPKARALFWKAVATKNDSVGDVASRRSSCELAPGRTDSGAQVAAKKGWDVARKAAFATLAVAQLKSCLKKGPRSSTQTVRLSVPEAAISTTGANMASSICTASEAARQQLFGLKRRFANHMWKHCHTRDLLSRAFLAWRHAVDAVLSERAESYYLKALAKMRTDLANAQALAKMRTEFADAQAAEELAKARFDGGISARPWTRHSYDCFLRVALTEWKWACRAAKNSCVAQQTLETFGSKVRVSAARLLWRRFGPQSSFASLIAAWREASCASGSIAQSGVTTSQAGEQIQELKKRAADMLWRLQGPSQLLGTVMSEWWKACEESRTKQDCMWAALEKDACEARRRSSGIRRNGEASAVKETKRNSVGVVHPCQEDKDMEFHNLRKSLKTGRLRHSHDGLVLPQPLVLNDEVAALKGQLESQHALHAKQLEALRVEHVQQLEHQHIEHARQLEAQRVQHGEQLEQQRTEFAQQLDFERTEHLKELLRAKKSVMQERSKPATFEWKTAVRSPSSSTAHSPGCKSLTQRSPPDTPSEQSSCKVFTPPTSPGSPSPLATSSSPRPKNIQFGERQLKSERFADVPRTANEVESKLERDYNEYQEWSEKPKVEDRVHRELAKARLHLQASRRKTSVRRNLMSPRY